MDDHQRSQPRRPRRPQGGKRREGWRSDLIIPNPKLRLLDQVRDKGSTRVISDVSTTMIYTHVLRLGGSGMKSPLDCL
jgi:hypothetical protein